MHQAKFHNGSSIANVQDWLTARSRDYASVRGRLEACRNVVLRGRLDSAARMLRASYINAVFSIQTAKDRHERAFTAYFAGDKSLKEAALMTVYGGQKYGWIEETMQSVDWRDLALIVRSNVRRGKRETALEAVNDMLKGVSYAKGAFMLAMVGMHEYMCIDSNVSRYADVDGRGYDYAAEYLAACDTIHTEVTGGNPYVPPFIAQWAIYDFERGEHARHMPFYREVLYQ